VSKNVRVSLDIDRVGNRDFIPDVGLTTYNRSAGIATLWELSFIAEYAHDVLRAIKAFVFIWGV
jgi:hypothetical protein